MRPGGHGPQCVERLFGGPGFSSCDQGGPVEWWYPGLGVTACFPSRLLLTPEGVKVYHGGVE